MKQKLRRENLSYLPPTIALRKEAEVRAIVAAINARIAEGNRKAASGPPLNLAPFDPERVVARWRAAREG